LGIEELDVVYDQRMGPTFGKFAGKGICLFLDAEVISPG
jgi:hypothetical protein